MDLFNKVQVEYNEAVTENEELAAFLTDLSEKLKTAVGDALAGSRNSKAGRRLLKKKARSLPIMQGKLSLPG